MISEILPLMFVEIRTILIGIRTILAQGVVVVVGETQLRHLDSGEP